jgi:N-succinyldiaminopimelate aminotransferase
MPRFPHTAAAISQMRRGVFSRLAHRIAAIEGEVYPLHVGDTWMEPWEGSRMEDLTVAEHPGMHRYARPQGDGPVLELFAAHYGVEKERILVAAGATGGLSSMASALLEAGDEVLILAPYWPLISGIVKCARGVPVEVGFFDEWSGQRTESEQRAWVRTRIEAQITPRTAAIYVNSPNNPTGKVLDRVSQEVIAQVAREHSLWVWSDEIYERYAYARPHICMGEHAPERTFVLRSFSKTYGMAGNRCGTVVGPSDPDVMFEVRKVSTHSFFCSPRAAQLAAARVLKGGEDWVARARRLYEDAGIRAARRLGEPIPEGGTFLFIDVSEHLQDGDLHDFLVRCIDRGLVLAPGSSCGAAWSDHVRLCFTSAAPDVVDRGVEQLAQLLGR